jgi:ABC-2 type transport system ATP-binding protein
MNGYSIEVNELTKVFGSFVAVDKVSFKVRTGEIFGFLGANGAGKSTTIRMLCGLLSSSSGNATVGGFDINDDPGSVKRNIGYMSQKFSLYDDLTVGENITFFGGIYGLSNNRLASRKSWALELSGLTGKAHMLTHELAGGWKQRLALVCALLHEPPIIFLDEPTGGVDPLSRRKFWELIQFLSDSGTTIFVTTHYLDEAEYCNTVTLIHGGKIVAGGSPGDLKSRFITNPVLEVETNNSIEALALLQSRDWVVETAVFGAYLHVGVRDEREGRRNIERDLVDAGIGVKRIERITPSLEDVFIHLVDMQSADSASR